MSGTEPRESGRERGGSLRIHRSGRVPGEIADLTVEGVVEELPGIDVDAVGGAFLGAQVFLHLGHRLDVGEFGGDAHGGALERLADELGVAYRGRADAGDEGADLGTDFDQAVVAEAAERLADRRATDAEAFAQLGLREAFAGGQLGADDLVAQGGVEVRATRRTAGAAGALGSVFTADRDRLGHVWILVYKRRTGIFF